jgi:hypothetical protein
MALDREILVRSACGIEQPHHQRLHRLVEAQVHHARRGGQHLAVRRIGPDEGRVGPGGARSERRQHKDQESEKPPHRE